VGWTMVLSGVAVLAMGCQTPPPAPNGTAPGGWTLEITTPDISVNAPQRFEVVLSQGQGTATLPVVFGTLQLTFAYLGSDGAGVPAPRGSTTAHYLPVPGTPATGTGPVRADPGAARGAYIADDVRFDTVGVWSATATADLTGGAAPVRVSATFPVARAPVFPAAGQHAIPVDNPTIGSGVPAVQIDSRAAGGNPVPDPELHRWSVREALAAHRSILLLFSTPAYCKSQVCGPETDTMARLAKRYANRAVFIHVEVWKNFGTAALSPAATPWLLHHGVLNEPWLYLIDARGTIVDRWPPLLFDWQQIAAELRALPARATGTARR
jgi:hypothetical protein